VSFNNHYTWKAGLPHDILILHGSSAEDLNYIGTVNSLNLLKTPNRTLNQAAEMLNYIEVYCPLVALNPDIALQRERGSSIISVRCSAFENGRMGVGTLVEEPDKGLCVRLNEYGKHMKELFEHWDIPICQNT
jgi:hypothetical protein